MVAGHVLAGVALGVLAGCVVDASAPLCCGLRTEIPFGNAGLLSLWCGDTITGVLGGLGFALIFNLVSVLVRRRWLRVPAFVLLTTLLLAPRYGALSFVALLGGAVVQLIGAMSLTRFGVLAMVAFGYTIFIIQDLPLTTNWSAWYVQATVLALATIMALAFYGLVITLRARPLSRDVPRGLSANAA